jgi:GntR family transcriptional regulator/MocR family aminotransferase
VRPAADLDLPVVLDRGDATPLHRQLAAALRAAALAGLIPPGGRLPPTRLLADRLGVARSTVLAAYQQLDGEGYVESRHGSGTYLTGHLRPGSAALSASSPPATARPRSGELVDRDVIDLRPGPPDIRRLADAAWHRAWRAAVDDPPPATEPPGQGLPELRAEIAAHLAVARGLSADPDAVFVTAGTRDGLSLLVHALRLRGRPVAVEDPGYPDARRLLARHGCTPLPVAVDGDGLVLGALPKGRAAPPLVLLTPSHQYPLGGRLPIPCRLALLDWAARHEATLVEDDYDSEFRFDVAPLPALASLDQTGRVVHLGTFGKVISPWLRIGYLVAPDRLVPELRAVRDDFGTPVSGVDQQAMAAYMAGGALRRHIARTRRDYRHTRAHLTRLLTRRTPGIRIRGNDAGLHVVLELPDGLDAGDVIRHARRHGVLLDNLDDYAVRTPRSGPPALVLGYGGATLDHLDRAVTALHEALRDS